MFRLKVGISGNDLDGQTGKIATIAPGTHEGPHVLPGSDELAQHRGPNKTRGSGEQGFHDYLPLKESRLRYRARAHKGK